MCGGHSPDAPLGRGRCGDEDSELDRGRQEWTVATLLDDTTWCADCRVEVKTEARPWPGAPPQAATDEEKTAHIRHGYADLLCECTKGRCEGDTWHDPADLAWGGDGGWCCRSSWPLADGQESLADFMARTGYRG